MRRIIILLPAFNEKASIETLLLKIDREARRQKWDYCVLVANDGSSDATGEILGRLLQKLPLEVLTHKINRGLGETSRDLFERASELASEGDVIVRMDCDDTHEPEIVGALLEKLDEGYDVVIASRFQPGGGQMGVSPYRAFVSRAANLFMKIFFPIRGVREYSCGFRAYRGEIIQQAITVYGNNFIQLKGMGFTCTLEKLVKLNLLGAHFAEVPFVLRYDQKKSPSKMVSSITTMGYLVMTVLYYWPWGGWRRQYRALRRHESEHG